MPSHKYSEYLSEVKAKELSHRESWLLASEIILSANTGADVSKPQSSDLIGCNALSARTREGYYRFNGCLQAAVNRALKFSPLSDMVWIETKEPNLRVAQSISSQILNHFPKQFRSS